MSDSYSDDSEDYRRATAEDEEDSDEDSEEEDYDYDEDEMPQKKPQRPTWRQDSGSEDDSPSDSPRADGTTKSGRGRASRGGGRGRGRGVDRRGKRDADGWEIRGGEETLPPFLQEVRPFEPPHCRQEHRAMASHPYMTEELREGQFVRSGAFPPAASRREPADASDKDIQLGVGPQAPGLQLLHQERHGWVVLCRVASSRQPPRPCWQHYILRGPYRFVLHSVSLHH
jgi:hypothetical protein